LLGQEAEAAKERDRERLVRPRDGFQAGGAARSGAGCERIDHRPSDPPAPPSRVDRDEVHDRDLGPVRTPVPDQEPTRRAVLVLGQPARAGEVPEPGPPDERPDATAAEPLIEDRGDARMVRLGRVTQADVLRHRDEAAAMPPPARSWRTTSGQPWTSSR